MKIFLGTDHAGFELKEHVKIFLKEKGYDVVDCGTFEYNKQDDYPDFISKAAREVAENQESFGIVFGKSGAGECIVANKIKGIRAVLAVNEKNVKLSRTHNNANILSVGSLFFDVEKANRLVKLFLNTEFSGEERHRRRIEKIKIIENEQ